MGPQLYGQLIFDKAGKTIQWKKQSIQQMVLGKLVSDMQKNETWSLSYTIHKNKLKMNKDLSVRQETIKILKEKTGNNISDLGRSNFLLDTSLKAREIKAKMNYWDRIKISFCMATETINKTKKQPTEWEEMFANDISDKGLVSKICKELIKLNTQKTNNPVKKRAEDMNRPFSEDIQMAKRHMKRCSTSLIIREIPVKTTLRYHLTPVRVAKINNSGKNRCW